MKYTSILILQNNGTLWEYFPEHMNLYEKGHNEPYPLFMIAENVKHYTNIGGNTLFIKNDNSLWLLSEKEKFGGADDEKLIINQENIENSLIKISDDVKEIIGEAWSPIILFKKLDNSLWYIDDSKIYIADGKISYHYKITEVAQDVKHAIAGAYIKDFGRIDPGFIFFTDSNDTLWKCYNLKLSGQRQSYGLLNSDKLKYSKIDFQQIERITDDVIEFSWFSDPDMGDSRCVNIIKRDGNLYKLDPNGNITQISFDLNIKSICYSVLKKGGDRYQTDYLKTFVLDMEDSLWQINENSKRKLFSDVKQVSDPKGYKRNTLNYGHKGLVLKKNGQLFTIDGNKVAEDVWSIYKEMFIVKEEGVYSLFEFGALREQPKLIIFANN